MLVRSSGLTDPDTGCSVTVKRYHSVKIARADGSWRQIRIILEPLNQAHEPIELTPENWEDFAVIGEFVRVVRLT